MADLRQLPKVDALARMPELQEFSDAVRIRAARQAITEARALILAGNPCSPETIKDLAVKHAGSFEKSSLRRVINGSGVVLHTGLGRARLSSRAADDLIEAAHHHTSVEFELDTGVRGDRQTHVRDLLSELTGASDAHVVNNCAAAVFLSLNAICAGKSVLLSRGQMVEIGGAFRMPDIVRQSGCNLIEVGCTNKTHLRDYEQGDDGNVAAILRCHPSNFKMVGFVEEPPADELSALCKSKGWVFIDDVGSGTLVDTSQFGLPKEPTLQQALQAGADVVLSSGDKMLGGPQAGLILGSKSVIEKIRKHPLARAMRVDKLTLAALAATLKLFVSGQEGEIPTLWALGRSLESVKNDAERIQNVCPKGTLVEEGLTEVGGGSIPGTGVPTWRVGISCPSLEHLATSLRTSTPGILGRIEKDRLWLDPRTMDEADVNDVMTVIKALAL